MCNSSKKLIGDILRAWAGEGGELPDGKEYCDFCGKILDKAEVRHFDVRMTVEDMLVPYTTVSEDRPYFKKRLHARNKDCTMVNGTMGVFQTGGLPKHDGCFYVCEECQEKMFWDIRKLILDKVLAISWRQEQERTKRALDYVCRKHEIETADRKQMEKNWVWQNGKCSFCRHFSVNEQDECICAKGEKDSSPHHCCEKYEKREDGAMEAKTNILDGVTEIPDSTFLTIGRKATNTRADDSFRQELLCLYGMLIMGAGPNYLDMKDEMLRCLKALNDDVTDVYANMRMDVIVDKRQSCFVLCQSDDVNFRTKQFNAFTEWMRRNDDN